MRPIPEKLKKEMLAEKYYKQCSLKGHGECGGRITLEHAIIYAGRQLNERWAIIPLCERHHQVGIYQDAGTLEKDRNVWVALNRATDEELHAVSKVVNYYRMRDNLNNKYGEYKEDTKHGR